MSSYSDRWIVNEAASIATDETPDARSARIEEMEEKRDELGITMPEIDDILQKPDNWYSNRVRGGEHSHDFSLASYHEVGALLDNFEESDDDDILEKIQTVATSRRNGDIRQLEEIREVLELKESTIEGVLNKNTGWYDESRSGQGNDFSLTSYVKALLFVETVFQFSYHSDNIGDEPAEYLLDRGFINPDLLNTANAPG